MVVLGRIVAPYGVQGWLRLSPFGDDPASWRQMKQLWLCRDAEFAEAATQALTLQDLRAQGKSWVLKFAEVIDRSAAEKWDGCYVGAPRENLPKTAPDEYYWGDLVGLAVQNGQGVALGRVVSLLESGAHPVLVVQQGDKERLIPFVAHVLQKVDVAKGVLQVDWEADW